MITLNLISPTQRGRLGRRRAVDEFRSLAVTVLYVALLVTTTLSAAQLLLTETLKTIEVTSLAETAAEEQDIDRAATKVVAEAVRELPAWSPFLLAFTATVPQGISLTSLDLNLDRTLTLRGHANTRDQLLGFQTSLGRSGLVANLQSPIQNLLKPTDVSFEIKATVASSSLP